MSMLLTINVRVISPLNVNITVLLHNLIQALSCVSCRCNEVNPLHFSPSGMFSML